MDNILPPAICFFPITTLLCLLSSSSVVPSCVWRLKRRVSAAEAVPRCCRWIQTQIRAWERLGGCWPSYWHPCERVRGRISSGKPSGSRGDSNRVDPCSVDPCNVHAQIRRCSSCRSLRAFSYLLLLLALLLASVVGALPHGQPPLGVRGCFGVVVFG